MKIDISQIITDQINTLRNDANGRISVGDIFIFFIVPVIVGVAATAASGATPATLKMRESSLREKRLLRGRSAFGPP